MILRSRKNRPITARNARGAKGPKRRFLFGLIQAVFGDLPTAKSLSAKSLTSWAVAAALALSPAAAGLESTARGAEPRRISGNSSLKWRPASGRTSQSASRPSSATPIEPAVAEPTEPASRADEGPGLIDADRSARPIPGAEADEPAATISSYQKPSSDGTIPWPRRDNSIRLTQATQPVPPSSNPSLNPFPEDSLKSDLRRLGTPAQGAPPTGRPVPGTTRDQAPRPFEPTTPGNAPTPLPSTGQLAVGGGGFQEEKCPELSELKKISAITNNVTAQPGELPRECFFDTNVLSPTNRPWMQTTYMWKASNMCHKPLYFEQVALERYGHSTGPLTQPIVNGAHFFLTMPILPYKMGIELPWECKYALGYYRPGSCAPYIIPPVPLSARGAALETAAAATLIYTLP